jgi:hypothetical protein
VAQEKETVTVNDKHDKNLNKNLHNIFNRLVTELEAPEGEAPDKQEERSPRTKEADLVSQAVGAYPTRSHPLKLRLPASRRKLPLKTHIFIHTRSLSSSLQSY